MSSQTGRSPQPPRSSRVEPTDRRTAIAIPRGWLVTLAALLILPWLVVAFVYGRHNGSADAPDAPAGGVSAPVARPSGPWGRLTLTPIVISPPLEYVSIAPLVPALPVWRFPGVAPGELEQFLTSGLPAADAAELHATMTADRETRSVLVKPSAGLVQRLDPQARSRLYTLLGRSALNPAQAHAYRYQTSSFAEWFGSASISPETRQLIEPYVYRHGDYLYFADFELVRSRIADPEEVRRLAKALNRQPTVVVRLVVDNPAEIAGVAEYWGRGGRRTDVRPLIESLAGRGHEASIDVVHLLPTFARNHLYRYPRVTAADFDKPIIANCLWSSLNFFNGVPDDRFLDVQYALETLKRDYYVVETGFQLGDIVAFLNEENVFHVAVYLADDLVFTKNGTSPMAPWTIATIDAVKGYYRMLSEKPRLIIHRRQDF